jgi:hypothetical protein
MITSLDGKPAKFVLMAFNNVEHALAWHNLKPRKDGSDPAENKWLKDGKLILRQMKGPG